MLDSSEFLCNKVLLKYKRDRESFWHRHQKGAERVPLPLLVFSWMLYSYFSSVQFSCSVMSDSFWPPWISACQASLSITNSQSLFKFMFTESVMQCNHLILCHPLLLLPSIFHSIRVFSNESALCNSWPNNGVSASTSVLSLNIQGWFPLEWTGWIFLQPKGLSRVFSNTTVQKHHFFGAQLSLQSNSHIHTWLLEKP